MGCKVGGCIRMEIMTEEFHKFSYELCSKMWSEYKQRKCLMEESIVIRNVWDEEARKFNCKSLKIM